MQQTAVAPRRTRLKEGINHVAYSPDGAHLAYSDVHMNLVLPGGVKHSLRSSNDKVRGIERVRDLAFSKDGRRVIATAGDQVWQFNATTGEREWSYMPPRAWGFLIISPLAITTAASGALAVSTDNSQILLWDPGSSEPFKIRTDDPQRVMTFEDESNDLVGFENFAMSHFDIRTGERKSRFRFPEKAYGMALSRGGDVAAIRTLAQLVLLSSQDGSIRARRNVEPGLPLLAFHPTMPLIAVGEDHFVSLVDFEAKLIEKIKLEKGEVVCIAFHPDGSEFAIGCSNHQIERHRL